MKPVHNNLMPESACGSESETASTRVSSKSQKKRNVPNQGNQGIQKG